ncbi:MAG: hypothetical protein OFPII_09240 [Osedax symbiont Rs1]|nr:MAG: hypothetical protein OFPII_09240 [Osedax symbiont Rs1]
MFRGTPKYIYAEFSRIDYISSSYLHNLNHLFDIHLKLMNNTPRSNGTC